MKVIIDTNILISAILRDLNPTLNISFPRDQKDAKFLACALTADADFFITGDHDFEDAQKLINTKIVSVSLFKKLVVDTA